MEHLRVDSRAAFFLLLLYWRPWLVHGVEFFFLGRQLPTAGTGRANVTDIGESQADSLECRSELPTTSNSDLGSGDWYLDPEIGSLTNTDSSNRIGDQDDGRGWVVSRETAGDQRIVRLMRVSDSALEGRFTCAIARDMDNPRGLRVLYPVRAVIHLEVVSRAQRTFRITCICDGGVPIFATLSGPSLPEGGLSLEPDTAVGGRGENQYSVATSELAAELGSVYRCSASNAVSVSSDRVEVTGAGNPTLLSLIQLTQTSLRVRWTQPSDGAPISSYTVLYTDSSGTRRQSLPVSAMETSLDIVGLTAEEMYTVSVDATVSGGLPGISEERTITLRRLTPPQEVAVGLGSSDPLTVAVSWQEVVDADRYTVRFTQLRGEDQLGNCDESVHRSSVSVAALRGEGQRVWAIIPVGTNVAMRVTDMLRAYTTYSVTVESDSDDLGTSLLSETVVYTTPQIAAAAGPSGVTVTPLNSTAISVEWERIEICRNANGRIVRYRIQYGTEPEGMVWNVDVPGEKSSGGEVVLTRLRPFTQYSVQVAAVNEEGVVGVYSNPKAVLTPEDVPGPISHPAVVTSFSKLVYTWAEPQSPNGVITAYEIILSSADSSDPPARLSPFCLSFTTPDRYRMGTEVNLTVVAFTLVGAGPPTTITASTLTRPPAVDVREALPLNDSAVHISWNPLSIPDFEVDNYTVVYSGLTATDHRREERASQVFPGSATSAVIVVGLAPETSYMFRVFATVTVEGQPLEGELSRELYVNGVPGDDQEAEVREVCGSEVAVLGSAFGISGFVVGLIVGALSAAVVTYKIMRRLSARPEPDRELAVVMRGERSINKREGDSSASGGRSKHSRELREGEWRTEISEPSLVEGGDERATAALGPGTAEAADEVETERNPAYDLNQVRESMADYTTLSPPHHNHSCTEEDVFYL